MEPRLKSAIRVKALIRRCDIAAIGVAVTSRGDPDAGAILLKLIGRDFRCSVLAQARSAGRDRGVAARDRPRPGRRAGGRRLHCPPARRDPDLWVVEIESEAVETLLDMPILT